MVVRTELARLNKPPYTSTQSWQIRGKHLTGKYRLLRATRAVHRDEKGFLVLPKDSVVHVEDATALLNGGELIPARWSDRYVLVFLADLQERGIKIGD